MAVNYIPTAKTYRGAFVFLCLDQKPYNLNRPHQILVNNSEVADDDDHLPNSNPTLFVQAHRLFEAAIPTNQFLTASGIKTLRFVFALKTPA